ncbi:MAG TPA: ankyrin repeat domain-containing protein [Pyrinomonadaceae bacterium]|nr:ankyrin repeat domain-containing protein [Pyrinomonadaceae bacterium]
MSATVRKWNTPDVTSELLRTAESGDVNELLRLLPRVGDINARNRYGTTALMKAAFFGHEPVVRVLLERGADPNLIRNDRFTALALAAFFGHAETVTTLIEFGARTEAVTRAGASARTWAKARTFDEVARCLERHAPKTLTVVPTSVPMSEPVPVDVTRPDELVSVVPTVKTLKDPPEIWDLVHEEPRNFNPRSAFVARITSMRKTFAVGACAAVLLIVGCGVGLLVLRGSHVRDLPPEIAPAPIAAETTVSRPPEAQPVVESPPVQVVNDNHVRGVPNKARLSIRQPRPAPVVSEAPLFEPGKEEPAVATPLFESPKPAPPAVKTNPNAALSPNVITPAKNAPPKGKVIQWP